MVFKVCINLVGLTNDAGPPVEQNHAVQDPLRRAHYLSFFLVKCIFIFINVRVLISTPRALSSPKIPALRNNIFWNI